MTGKLDIVATKSRRSPTRFSYIAEAISNIDVIIFKARRGPIRAIRIPNGMGLTEAIKEVENVKYSISKNDIIELIRALKKSYNMTPKSSSHTNTNNTPTTTTWDLCDNSDYLDYLDYDETYKYECDDKLEDDRDIRSEAFARICENNAIKVKARINSISHGYPIIQMKAMPIKRKRVLMITPNSMKI